MSQPIEPVIIAVICALFVGYIIGRIHEILIDRKQIMKRKKDKK